MELKIPIEVDFDDLKSLLDDLGKLQKYKLFEGDKMVLVDVDDVADVLTRHIKAKEKQPERKKGKWIKKMRVTETEKYISYDPDWYCACCGTKYDPHIAKIVNFCYVCGEDMRGEQDG